MNFSPQDQEKILKMAAQLIVEEVKQAAGGDLASLIVIPLGAAGQMVGLSRQQLPKLIPVTAIGKSSHGVTLRNLQNHIEKNTRQPRP